MPYSGTPGRPPGELCLTTACNPVRHPKKGFVANACYDLFPYVCAWRFFAPPLNKIGCGTLVVLSGQVRTKGFKPGPRLRYPIWEGCAKAHTAFVGFENGDERHRLLPAEEWYTGQWCSRSCCYRQGSNRPMLTFRQTCLSHVKVFVTNTAG